MEKFRFRKHDTIGAVAAEQDNEFLRNCFVDTGDLNVLRNCSDPKRLIVGRVGSGKSALLQRLCDVEEHTIVIPPEALALGYVANSTILNYVSELGVNLDIFFRLLWRHVLTVELLRARFGGGNDDAPGRTFFEWLNGHLRPNKHKKAVEYLQKWGRSFWEDTEYRLIEVTRTLENDVRAELEAAHLPILPTLSATNSMSEQQRTEVVKRAQHVINQVQIRELSTIIDLVADVLDDPQQRYYLVIDKLDENWVDDRIRYRLIRALIETAKDFHKVQHAKIVIALRQDLVDRVFKLTRDTGFQEEKYEDDILPVRWTRQQLIEVLDARIAYLIRRQSKKAARVTHKDVFPARIDKIPTVDYMLARTLMRPRDVILFFNECIAASTGEPLVSVSALRQAEGLYSRGRLRSLADEWGGDYPNLLWTTELLKGKPPTFPFSLITEEEVGDLCLDGAGRGFGTADVISRAADAVANDRMSPITFWAEAVELFYRVGLVGLKAEPYDKTQWSIEGRRSISSADIRANARISIHPAFWRALGVRAS